MNTAQHATYRSLLQHLAAEGKLTAEGLATLATLQAQLGLPREDVLTIEREVLGRSKEEALAARLSGATPAPVSMPAPGAGAAAVAFGAVGRAGADGAQRAAAPVAVAATLSGGQTAVGAADGLDAHGGGSAAGGLRPGEVVAGRFEVRAVLGEGGMGQVLRVLDRKLGAERAMKVIRAALVRRADIAARFRDEVITCQRLSHPNIVRVFDYDEDESRGLRFFTMELVDGVTLRRWLQARRAAGRPPTLDEFETIARSVCEALTHVHTVTIHRDLKPENVMIDPTTLATKLMDFGIAKVLDARSPHVTAGPLGTAYYMAPEVDRGGPVDARADIYAAAVMFYELLAGELPRAGSKALSDARRDVPAAISRAIGRAMSSNPEERFATAAAFCDALLGARGAAGGDGFSAAAVVGSLNQMGAVAGRGLHQISKSLLQAREALRDSVKPWSAPRMTPPAGAAAAAQRWVAYVLGCFFAPLGALACVGLWKREASERRERGEAPRPLWRFLLAAPSELYPWPAGPAALKLAILALTWLTVLFWGLFLTAIAAAIIDEL